MEDKVEVKKKRNINPPRGVARGRPEKKVPRHSFELKRKAVRLYLEEGFSAEDIVAETGISIQLT
jgi:transposase-like protein